MLVPRCTSTWVAAIAFAALALGACGDSGGTTDGADVESTDGALADGVADSALDAGPDAATDAGEDVEILYPGNPCGGDDQCSTGLCYGLATPQGAFEKPKCQSLCLDLNDFRRYCDSDDDCCKGRCCIGCGAREGLCVMD